MKCNHLPFEPLAAYVGEIQYQRRGGPSERGGNWEPYSPARAVAIALGDTVAYRRAALRWVQTGLKLDLAENVCDALGVHPIEIWGDQYRWVQPEPEEEPHGLFGGREPWYRCTGKADFYGDPLADDFRRRMGAAA